MDSRQYGALAREWAHFGFVLGLVEDLLPVVSDPTVKISPNSKMSTTGKTPSIINREGFAAGLKDWTSKRSTAREVKNWSKDSRLGVSIQTRTVRAIDVDVDDEAQAAAILSCINRHAALPARTRSNSNKRLLALTLPGDMQKRIIRTEHGIIEFLATGQQFIACGTHTSGVRYEWAEGLPESIPAVTQDAFEALWSDLNSLFGVSSIESKAAVDRKEVLTGALASDPVANYLLDNNWVLSAERDGRLHITCPFTDQHTGESAESSTTYFPANTGGFARGHFRCLHAHCEHRTDYEFEVGIGYEKLTFDDVTNEPPPSEEEPVANPGRFTPVHVADFAVSEPPSWIIKNVLPQAALGVMFGDSGSGKSFMALDMVSSIALGTPWRGHKTVQGNVAYIAAEGAGGFKKRLQAYAVANELSLRDIPMQVIAAAPNLLEKRDVNDLIAALKAAGEFAVVVVDTLAQTTAGGNENSGEDMGKALKHCGAIHYHTGAMVLLIHHSGKNAAAGARGWSGLRAATDVELEVLRSDEDRVVSVTKQKDGEEGAEYGFRLRVVPIGMDEDGDSITSCVVDIAQVSARHQRAVLKLGNNEKVVMRAIRDNITLDGLNPDENTVVTKAIEQMDFDPERTKNDKRRQNTLRAIEGLIEKGLIARIDGRVVILSDKSTDNQEDTSES